MTTKEAIKTILSADYGLSYAIGYTANMKKFDSNVFDALVSARRNLEEVAFALCDELPDHIADPGKKVFIGDSRTGLGLQDPMMYGEQPVNLCAKGDG